ncbi:hypothetical protein EPN44_08680 [bacterium]|nr:MAG: hypothetical protein EPN44_08680 [bacterium]
MLLPLLLATVIAAAPTSSPGLAAPTTQQAPLREVVYRASFTRRQSLAVGHFGAVPPDAWGHQTGDHGTITVDVMAVGLNALGIKLIESWSVSGKNVTFLGNVAPDGTVNFGDQELSDCSRDLLPFFAPLIANAQDLAPGISWVQKYNDKAVDITTTYSVSKIDGPVATIGEQRKLEVHSALGMSGDLDGWVTYKPSKLVPIAGRLSDIQRRSTASSEDTIQTTITFERVSDSLDKETR